MGPALEKFFNSLPEYISNSDNYLVCLWKLVLSKDLKRLLSWVYNFRKKQKINLNISNCLKKIDFWKFASKAANKEASEPGARTDKKWMQCSGQTWISTKGSARTGNDEGSAGPSPAQLLPVTVQKEALTGNAGEWGVQDSTRGIQTKVPTEIGPSREVLKELGILSPPRC